MRVDLLKGGKQAAGQHHLLVVPPFRGLAITGEVRSVSGVVAPGLEPVETELFLVVFSDLGHKAVPLISFSNICNRVMISSTEGYSPKIMFAIAR